MNKRKEIDNNDDENNNNTLINQENNNNNNNTQVEDYHSNLKKWNSRKRHRANELMHKDNIYRNNPPNFKELAKKYPNFNKFILNKHEKIYNIDWKNAEAVRELTITLLDNDFNLKVSLPHDHLCPTVTSRLNYLLWIKDCYSQLLQKNQPINTTTVAQQSENDKEKKIIKEKEISVIDIGTGASCIYPLLGVRMFGWNFLATEIDIESVKFANENIVNNQMEHNIKVKHVEDKKLLLNGVINDSNDEHFDISICNPPFFEDINQTNLNHKTICTGNENELITKGGELEFIENMIRDSLVLRSKIKLYSTLLGRKKNIENVIEILKNNNIFNYQTTELAQGNCSRWAICWSFLDNLNLCQQQQQPQQKQQKQQKQQSTNTNTPQQEISKQQPLTRKQRRSLERPGIKETFISTKSTKDIIDDTIQYLNQIGITIINNNNNNENNNNNNSIDCIISNISSNKWTDFINNTEINNNNNNNNDNIENINNDNIKEVKFKIEYTILDKDRITIETKVDLREVKLSLEDNLLIKSIFKLIFSRIEHLLK